MKERRCVRCSYTDIGGGSIAVGTLEFYKRYRACRIDALNYYNHGNKNTNLSYGTDAWANAQQFSPSHPLSKIFP